MGEGTRWLELIKSYAAISLWVGALFATVLSLIVAVWNLPDPYAVAWLALMVSLISLSAAQGHLHAFLSDV